MSLLSAEGVSFRWEGRLALADVSVALRPGELLGIVGPNGAGKSTLLGLLTGLLTPSAEIVRIGGEPLSALSRRQIAQRVALVPQVLQAGFAYPVRDFVAMGRTPHLARFQPEGPRDREAVAQAMEETQTSAIAERPVTELSGGEWQRVLLARALAQGAPVLALDEPTSHLDLRHQIDFLEAIRRRLSSGVRAAVAVLHDLALAARHCTRIVLLDRGRVRADGPPSESLTSDLICEIFGVETRLLKDPQTGSLEVIVIGPSLPG